MTWALMTTAEIHAFGIHMVLQFIEKEGVTVQHVNPDIKMNPQIVGQRWGSLAYIYVRTACYPGKGALGEEEFFYWLDWAKVQTAPPFFGSVGIACTHYPDKTPVQNDADMRLPMRNSGFAVTYEGLLLNAYRLSLLGESQRKLRRAIASN